MKSKKSKNRHHKDNRTREIEVIKPFENIIESPEEEVMPVKETEDKTEKEEFIQKEVKDITNGKPLTKETLFEGLEAFFSKKSSSTDQLELHALYIAGKLTQENHELKIKIANVKQENMELREMLRSLPGSVDEISEKISDLEKENKELKEIFKMIPGNPEKISEILLQNAENLHILNRQKESLERQLKTEKEDSRTTIKRLEARIQETEAHKLKLAEKFSKEILEANKPWWRKFR